MRSRHIRNLSIVMDRYEKVKMASTAVPKQEGVKLGTTSAFVQLGNKLVEDTDPKMSPRLKFTALFSIRWVYFRRTDRTF